MKVKDLMTRPAIRIRPEEPITVAARTLEHYNIGALPVCTGDGRICGMVTDRDLTVRCLASEHLPAMTRVREVMTNNVITVTADMEAEEAASLMARKQVRRLPVLENGRLCGMLSVGDLAAVRACPQQAMEALADIHAGLSSRK